MHKADDTMLAEGADRSSVVRINTKREAAIYLATSGANTAPELCQGVRHAVK